MINNKIYEFNIGDLIIPYTLSNSNKSEHIRLLMDIDGLKVTKPHNTNLEEVQKILDKKSNWIFKHYNEFNSMKVDEYIRNWESGERILYRGRRYNIRIFDYLELSTIVTFNGKRFEVFANGKLNEDIRKRSIETKFIGWFKHTALNTIKERVDYYSKITGLKFTSIKIKDQNTRWGSCSSKGNLNFNWKIIMSPPWVIDYVVLHEICHLKYMNHSKEYWDMVEMYMPDYKKAYSWLKKNGLILSL